MRLEGLTGLDWGLPTDARLVVVMGVIFLAGYAKGVAGLGVPLIATPILALLYDLRTAIVVVSLPMTLSDVPFVLGGIRHYREAVRVMPFVLFGLIGVFLGTRLLALLNPTLLAAVLGIVITVFVITSWFHVLPTMSHRAARLVGPPLGFVSGVVQGSSGASGPLVTMYLLSLGIPRYVFFFTINTIFQLQDAAQFIALQQVGLYSAGLTRLALTSCLPLAVGLALGFWTQKRIDDALFRRVILILLSVSAANLFVRVITSL